MVATSQLGGGARPIVASLVDEYLASIADLVYLPLPAAACRAALGSMLDDVIAALIAEDFSPAVGAAVGRTLVSLQITVPEAAAAAARTLASLPDELPAAASISRDELRRRVGRILAEFAGGYAAALADRILDGQAVVQSAAESARRSAQEGERQAQARIRIMFEHARSPVFVSDEQGRVIEASPVMAAMMDANRELLGPLGDDVRPLLSDDPRDVERVLHELAEADDESVSRYVEHHSVLYLGDTSVGRWVLSRVRSNDGRPALIVGVGHDVTALRAQHDQLIHLAHHDPLTGLPNRRRLAADVEAMPAVPIGFCLIDLDGFKAFNDELGHAAGDQVLVATAHRMQAALGGTGTLYRVGGDEFAVLVSPPFRPRDATELLHRALSTPFELRVPDETPRTVRVGASIGTTISSQVGATVEALIVAADTGLYRSKEARRG